MESKEESKETKATKTKTPRDGDSALTTNPSHGDAVLTAKLLLEDIRKEEEEKLSLTKNSQCINAFIKKKFSA